MNKKYLTYLKFLILGILLYTPIFGHLDTFPIRIWDEARIATNAYEMHKDGDWLVTHFEGKPEMLNTKPPFMTWCQVMFVKLIGVNELAIRLPSAFAAFCTCLILLILSIRYLQSFWLGFIAIMILITSDGYIGHHAARTGDYDAMLALFTTLFILCFFLFIEFKKTKFLYFFFIALSLAVLTKGVAGLMFLPALVIYSVWKRQFVSLIKNKHFWRGAGVFIVVALGYYLLRESQSPGYIDAVSREELGGRFLKTSDGHKEPFWFYYNGFIDYRFAKWYLLVPCGLLIGFFHKNHLIKQLSVFLFLLVSTHFLFISFAQTKLEWYDVPLYPLLSLMAAIFINYIFDLLRDKYWIGGKLLAFNTLPFIFLFLIFVSPYHEIFKKTYLPEEHPWHKEFYQIGYYLKKALKKEVDVNNQFLIYDGYNLQNQLYLKILRDKGVVVKTKELAAIEVNDVLIVSQDVPKKYIDEHFVFEVVHTFNNVLTYKINERK